VDVSDNARSCVWHAWQPSSALDIARCIACMALHQCTHSHRGSLSHFRSIARSDKCTHVRSYEYAMRLGEHTLAAGCLRATTLFFPSPSCAARSVLRALTLMCACASPMHPSIRSISDSHCRQLVVSSTWQELPALPRSATRSRTCLCGRWCGRGCCDFLDALASFLWCRSYGLDG
jgi:hypothetical protein